MILVTGDAGYIGSHACVALLSAGQKVVVFDNFCNSSPGGPERVKICGKPLEMVEGDIRDQARLEMLLTKYDCTSVMHLPASNLSRILSLSPSNIAIRTSLARTGRFAP
jgi:UDP-glucose 4-epimerase